MKAAVLRQPGSPLTIEEREKPKPGPGQVLIRVRACGVCHGDLMLQHGEFPFARYPVVPGHEIAGVVEDVGSGVKWPSPSARVGLSVLYSSCGNCKQCLSGNDFLCPAVIWTGVMRDGGYQEYLVAPAAYLAPLPEKLEFREAAPLMCAGLTVYSALLHVEFVPGDKVAVIGLGGLGHLGVLYARAMDARVAVLSTSSDKEAEARELGAELFINTRTVPAGEALQRWDGGADLILATAPSIESVNAGFAGLAPDGTMVVLGVGPGDIKVSPMVLINGRRRLMGSPAGSRKDLREALEFAAAHGVQPRVTPYALEAANEAIMRMESGAVRGRGVIVLD